MRTFYRFMAKRIPFIWWKFFWLRRVQAHVSKEIANARTLTTQTAPLAKG